MKHQSDMKQNTDPFIWQPRPNTLQSDKQVGVEANDYSVNGSAKVVSASATFASKTPLSGLKLAVKDLFHIAGIATSAGNPDWLKSHDVPLQTNPVVGKLLDAGVQLVGKTLTDEMAYSLNGQNIHYGTPINARTPDRLPGGSSSGSAAAVALKMADIGLGTDTGGSIRVPSSYNGLFGLRPTHGLISTEQMVGLAPRFDTVGWMTRDLTTLQQVAEVLFEKILQRTGTQQPSSQKSLQIKSLFCHCEELNNLVAHGEDINVFMKGVDSQATAFSTDILALASEAFRVLQGRQIWQEHGQWIQDSNPTFAPEIKSRFQWCATLTKEQEKNAEEQASEVNQTVSAMMASGQVFIMPTTPGPAPLLDTSSDDLVTYRNHLLGLTALAGLGGLPQLHIPLKSGSGPAIGISLLGNQNTDMQLISLAMRLMSKLPC